MNNYYILNKRKRKWLWDTICKRRSSSKWWMFYRRKSCL